VAIHVPEPSLQVDFAQRLAAMRVACLQPALAEVVRQLKVTQLDTELHAVADPSDLAALAGRGIRGEWLFAVPSVLRANPALLAYYRLILGFSQKEFYTSATGLSAFKALEERNLLSERAEALLTELCTELAKAAARLCRAIGYDQITLELLDHLSLLTLGPQLRGGANVRRGTDAISQVFRVIQAIVSPYLIEATTSRLRLRNAPGREVVIQFASDPDIVIQEVRRDGRDQLIVAVEVKGGRDFSNIHNRVGEAEKSHQKARQRGFTECWTVVNVDSMDSTLAKSESPSTDQFFLLSDLLNSMSSGYNEFRTRLVHLTSIPDEPNSASVRTSRKRSRKKL
jgi:hypothetical protein